MRIVNVSEGTAEAVEGVAYPVNVSALEGAGVALVVYPDSGPAWVERDPFRGREGSAALVALGDAAMAEALEQHNAPPTLAEAADMKRAEIEAARKAAEAKGVTLEGVRYAGDASNRQALREAIEYADAEGITAFSSWKSSDGEFLESHPVQAVRDAYVDIGARRSSLIGQEGQRVAEIDAAVAAEDREALEAVAW